MGLERRHVRVLVCAIVTVVSLSARAEDRAAVPDPKSLESAKKLVDETFRLGGLGKDAGQQLAAARKLLQAATTGRDLGAVRYAELCRARDLAAKVDLQLAMAVSDQLVKSFDLDAGKEQLDLLASSTARPTTPAVEGIISWSDEAITASRMDQGRLLANAAVNFAIPVRSLLVANDVREQSMRATRAAKEDRVISGLRARLKAKPEDAEARLQLGRLLCVEQDKWAEGLGFLQQTPDMRLRSVVELEMSSPSMPEAFLAAADAWWELADGDRAFPSAAARRRAIAWYERALPELDGLAKARAEGRLDQARGGDQASQIGGPGRWLTLALTSTKWGLASHSVRVERRGCSFAIANPDAGPLYLVNDRILPAGFAAAIIVKGHCLLGLLSADRVDQSLYCTVPGDGAWHEVRLQRDGQTVAAFQDGDAGQLQSYNARLAMPGVIGLQINAGQMVEVRSVSLR